MKKITYIFVITLLLSGIQFTQGQNNTFPSRGNVGIGTTDPKALLHIKGSQHSPQNHLDIEGRSSNITFTDHALSLVSKGSGGQSPRLQWINKIGTRQVIFGGATDHLSLFLQNNHYFQIHGGDVVMGSYGVKPQNALLTLSTLGQLNKNGLAIESYSSDMSFRHDALSLAAKSGYNYVPYVEW